MSSSAILRCPRRSKPAVGAVACSIAALPTPCQKSYSSDLPPEKGSNVRRSHPQSQGNESKGVMTYKMGLRGLWLFESFEGDFGDMKFEGKGATTYDTANKKYINVWLDSMSTAPMISEGNYENPGRMVMKGQMPG